MGRGHRPDRPVHPGQSRIGPWSGSSGSRRAVFRWAQAQTWVQAAAFEPAEPGHRERAIALLDDAIERLRSISTIGDRTTLGDNLRFRLAQALADRAELEPADSDDRRRRDDEAMDLLTQPATELGLAGYWHLLKADLWLRAGKPDEAGGELDAAVQAKPAPPEAEVLAVKVPLRIGQKQFAEAMRAVDASHLDGAGQGAVESADPPGRAGRCAGR